MKSFISLNKPFVFGICLTLFCAASATAQQQTPRALTESEMRAMEDLGSLVGRQAGDDAQAQSPEHQQGATEHSGGRVRIAGEWYDTDKITGGRDEPDRVDRAAAVEADGDMEDLRQLHDEVDEEIRAEGQSTARGSAYKSTHDSADTHQEGRQMVLDTNWDTTEQAFSDAHVGMIGEDTFPQCETTRTVIPGEKEVSVTDQEVCEKVVLAAGDENGVACVRERTCEGTNDPVAAEKSAQLNVAQDVSAQACSLDSEVVGYRDNLEMSRTGLLDITEETGGLSCRRTVWPETTEAVAPTSHDATLTIDDQGPTTSCSVVRTASGGGTVPWSGQVPVISHLNGPPNSGCVETHVVPVPPDYAHHISARRIYGHTTPTIIQFSAAGSGSTMVHVEMVRQGQMTQMCEISGTETEYVLEWNFNGPAPVNFGTDTTGNCSQGGTPNCPQEWACTASAPTTINGIPVTAADIQALPALFPGAPGACVAATRSSTCSGNATSDTTINLASRMPAGTTSIDNFSFTVQNPQSGVSVTLIQTPTLANGWVARFRTTRSNFNTQQAQPQIRMTWNSRYPETLISVVDDGSCGDTGSPACPAVWACERNAPFTVNGISVTAAMAGTQAPLFPGASSSCVVGTLTRICNGSSNTISSIPISDLLPAGTTAIRNFSWTWNNPDPALTVVLLEAPNAGNGWAARFDVTRDYAGGGSPPRPNITLNWEVDSELQHRIDVVEEGDCDGAEEGGYCPLEWTCLAHGPGTHDGGTVTQQMLNERGPLYEGDGPPPTCLDAVLENNCTGDGSAYTEIRLDDIIPDYVDSITDYSWEVTSQSPGVTITQVQAPSKENGWRAIFRTDRTDWSTAPSPPTVSLTWTMNGPTYYECEVIETGDCSVTSDEFCDAEWTCTREVEDPADEPTMVLLSSVTTSPMLFGNAFPGVPHSSTATFPGSLFPAGTVAVENFSWQITGKVGTGVCNANVTGKPTPGNPHSNVTVINGSGNTGGGGGGDYWNDQHDVYFQMMFNYPKESVHYRLAKATFDFIMPPAYAQGAGCGVYLQFRWDNMGYNVPPDPDATGPYRPDIEGQPPLFPDDGGACMQAELGVDCEAMWVGEECYINSDGLEVCVDQPPSDVPDTCGELEADENCTLVREECTEGGQSAGGWCYVRSYLYECTRAFNVPDPTIHEETICTEGSSGIPTVCMDGSCREEQPETVVRDVLEPAARMMIIQHQMKDYKRINSSSIPPGGGGPGPGDPQVPIINP